jgi:hypothetical protein
VILEEKADTISGEKEKASPESGRTTGRRIRPSSGCSPRISSSGIEFSLRAKKIAAELIAFDPEPLDEVFK